MNNVRLNAYKKVLQEVCKKFDGAKEFIKDKIEEICSNEKLSVVEVACLFMKDCDKSCKHHLQQHHDLSKCS